MIGENIYSSSLNTPSVIVDLDLLDANIFLMTELAQKANVKLRPHTKIHQCVEIAKMQIAKGACGIEVGGIEQAEVMMDGGIGDILIAHPFFGDNKFALFRRVVDKAKSKVNLIVVVDMFEQAIGISDIGIELGIKIPILIKIDTGVKRYGVPPGEPAVEFAKRLQILPGIEIKGIYAHESGINIAKGIEYGALEVAAMTSQTARLMRDKGFNIEHVSVGASPTFKITCQYLMEDKFPEITEIHPGALVIGDVLHVLEYGLTIDQCALTVLTTVTSTSHSEYVVVDAGFKTFGSESMIGHRDKPNFLWDGKPSYGIIKGRDDLWFGRVTAEAGIIYYKESAKKNIKIGDRIRIIPNNATVVINIHDKLYGVRGDIVERIMAVSGRGRGS